MEANPILYSIDSFFLLACMVGMFAELFYFQYQYRCRIAKAKETPEKTKKMLLIAAAVIIVLQVILSLIHFPIRPAYLIMLVVPAFFFRFGMYDDGVFYFGHCYKWEKITSCQVVSAKGAIQIHYETDKGKSFDLTFSSTYQEYILQLLQEKKFIPSASGEE